MQNHHSSSISLLKPFWILSMRTCTGQKDKDSNWKRNFWEHQLLLSSFKKAVFLKKILSALQSTSKILWDLWEEELHFLGACRRQTCTFRSFASHLCCTGLLFLIVVCENCPHPLLPASVMVVCLDCSGPWMLVRWGSSSSRRTYEVFQPDIKCPPAFIPDLVAMILRSAVHQKCIIAVND